MARSVPAKRGFALEFEAMIRGHHIYKSIWTPIKGEKLVCQHDTRDEAQLYDLNVIGVFREDGETSSLVGHLPMELSKLLFRFLKADGSNKLVAHVTGKRKFEVGLAVPVKYMAFSENEDFIRILQDELGKREEKLTYLNVKCEHYFRKRALYDI